jgi:hypothetical protein
MTPTDRTHAIQSHRLVARRRLGRRRLALPFLHGALWPLPASGNFDGSRGLCLMHLSKGILRRRRIGALLLLPAHQDNSFCGFHFLDRLRDRSEL